MFVQQSTCMDESCRCRGSKFIKSLSYVFLVFNFCSVYKGHVPENHFLFSTRAHPVKTPQMLNAANIPRRFQT